MCLSFYDERKDKWRCEDKCLTTVASKGTPNDSTQEESLLCGKTDHLTNFALLLTGSDGEDPCGSGKVNDNTLAWISLGMVGGAVLVIFLSVLALEVRIRRERYQINKKLAACFPIAIV